LPRSGPPLSSDPPLARSAPTVGLRARAGARARACACACAWTSNVEVLETQWFFNHLRSTQWNLKSESPINLYVFTHLRKPQVDLKCGTTKNHWFFNHLRAPQRNLNSENAINLKVFYPFEETSMDLNGTSTEPQTQNCNKYICFLII